MFILGLHVHVPPDVAAYKYLPMFNKVLLSAFDGQ